MSSYVFDRTVATLQAALEHAHGQGVKGRPKPERSDAVRLTWQVVEIATQGVRAERRAGA